MGSTLLERAIAREGRAVRELVGMLAPVIHKRVARVLRRGGAARQGDIRQDIVDVAQDVFVALLENDGRLLRAWNPARGMSLKNFVGLIAEQQAKATLRSQREYIWREVQSGDFDASLDSRTPERIVHARRMLVTLADRVRHRVSSRGFRAFQMLFLEGRPVEDVCCTLEMSVDAVHAWRSRLRRLIEQIVDEGFSSPNSVEPS